MFPRIHSLVKEGGKQDWAEWKDELHMVPTELSAPSGKLGQALAMGCPRVQGLERGMSLSKAASFR